MHFEILLLILAAGLVSGCENRSQEEQSSDTSAVKVETTHDCFEIAHRIACNTTGECQEGETDLGFQRRQQAEMMIGHLCTDGPDDFGEYYWIDIDGKYRPYYTDSNGKKTKIPPSVP